jgi:hypothetical protein
MTTTFDLTPNELKAARVLVQECLNGMGGDRPSDLDNDPYTWCDAADLIAAGWSKEAAAGTYGSLGEKGFIFIDGEGDHVTDAGYRFMDTIWDTQDTTEEKTMTVATIDTKNLKINFHVDAEKAAQAAEKDGLVLVTKPEDLGQLTGGQMVDMYNAITRELNAAGSSLADVNRFATKDAGIKRLMANITDLWELRREVAKTKAKAVPAQKITASANAAAKAKAKTSGGSTKELWRKVKEEAPSKVAYRPKEGSVQDGLYKLLTKLEPMTMEAYCEGAKKLKTRDATLFTPAQVWGALRYLFVTKRGYGLKFDGTRIWLVVPADERAAGQE